MRDNPDNAFTLFPDDYTPPKKARMTIKVKQGNLDNAKGPALKGFVALDLATARDLVAYLEAQADQVVFLDVAMWEPRNDPDWYYSGGVELRQYDPSQRKQKESSDAGSTDWY